MKRLIVLLLYMACAIATFAGEPKLNVESLFDGRYNNNKSVTISIYKNNGNYYRGMTVRDNPEIVRQITDAMSKDKVRAKGYSNYQGADGQYTSLQIENNGEIIFVGLQRDTSGGAFFFIQGKEKAFLKGEKLNN